MPDDEDYEIDLDREYMRYVATGDTYPYREEFTSWAWHWDSGRKAWVEDNHTEADNPAILFAKGLPGVTVTEEPDE